jgi:hypothetical protein
MITDNMSNQEIIEKYNHFLEQKKKSVMAGIIITLIFFAMFYFITNSIILSVLFTTCVAYFCALTHNENFIDNSDSIKLKALYKKIYKYTD